MVVTVEGSCDRVVDGLQLRLTKALDNDRDAESLAEGAVVLRVLLRVIESSAEGESLFIVGVEGGEAVSRDGVMEHLVASDFDTTSVRSVDERVVV